MPVNRTIFSLFAFLVLATSAASAQSLYTDAPLAYDQPPPYLYGFEINNGASADNTFTLTAPSTITSISFVNFTDPGSTTSNVDWTISSGDFTGTLASNTAAVTDSFISDYSVGSPGTEYEFSTGTFSTTPVTLSAGTYYLQLSNATSTDSGPVYWQDILYGTSTGDTKDVYGLEGGNSAAFSVYGSPAPAPESPSIVSLAVALVLMIVSISVVHLRRRQTSIES
jgi:hypothetical protein